jgi:hypothetical protein
LEPAADAPNREVELLIEENNPPVAAEAKRPPEVAPEEKMLLELAPEAKRLLELAPEAKRLLELDPVNKDPDEAEVPAPDDAELVPKELPVLCDELFSAL